MRRPSEFPVALTPPERIQHTLHQLAGIWKSTPALQHRRAGASRAPGLCPKQARSLQAVLPDAALRLFAGGGAFCAFLEQVDYNGGRLAKLAMPLERVEQALREAEAALLRHLDTAKQEISAADAAAALHHLRFATSITLHNAYHRVRQAEADAFYRLFAAELETVTLDSLLHRHLEILRAFSGAAAALLCWRDPFDGAWVLRAHTEAERNREAAASPAPPSRGRASRDIPPPRAPWTKLASPLQFGPTASRAPLLLDRSWASRYRYFWSIPFTGRAGLTGVMQFAFPSRYEWLPRELDLLNAAAERCVLAAEKTRLLEELAQREEQIRRLADRLSLVEERERRRISNELHDEAGQSLLLLRLQLEMLESAVPPEPDTLRAKLRDMRRLTERTIVEIRRLLAALSPKVLEKCGLEAALRQLANRFREHHPQTRLRLQIALPEPLSPKREVMLYRLTQECLNNVAKHSHAANVNISLTSADGLVRLSVKDDGVGFAVEQALALPDSFGLAGMRERVALLGGRFMVASRPGRGTEIRVIVPAAEAEAGPWDTPRRRDIATAAAHSPNARGARRPILLGKGDSQS